LVCDSAAVVHTGARADRLAEVLEETGLTRIGAAVAPPRPPPAEFTDRARGELLAVYRELGGLQAEPLFRPGAWDLPFAGNLVVELDEELHFNRYRAITLRASWEVGLAWTEAYSAFCAEHEAQCLSAGRWGKRWTSPSSARMFSGGPSGELDGAGAPRWKQRALYDAIKDNAASVNREVHLARVSTYDRINGVLLGSMLDGRQPLQPAAIRALIDDRMT